MTKDDGGPAFPLAIPAGFHQAEGGMTLRDWFAGRALTGLLADPDERPEGDDDIAGFIYDTAAACYEYADAMLAARAKGGDA